MAKRLLILLGLILAGLAAAALWRVDWQSLKKLPLPPGGDFLLQSSGGPVDSRQLRGQVLVLYFGYGHCPDVCPTSLAAVGQALTALAPEERTQVRAFMISVDPERDDAASLAQYCSYFHPGITGLSGRPEDISALARSYGVGYLKRPAAADGSYAVDHTTSTYLVGKDGKMVEVFPLGTPPDKIVTTIRTQL